jgi:hypothetical protein
VKRGRTNLRSTVPTVKPPRAGKRAAPPHPHLQRTMSPRRDVARIIDPSESSLVDVIDNLLNKGVVLNADLILALANVDLVYVRLSALLCAADRLMPRDEP